MNVFYEDVQDHVKQVKVIHMRWAAICFIFPSSSITDFGLSNYIYYKLFLHLSLVSAASTCDTYVIHLYIMCQTRTFFILYYI